MSCRTNSFLGLDFVKRYEDEAQSQSCVLESEAATGKPHRAVSVLDEGTPIQRSFYFTSFYYMVKEIKGCLDENPQFDYLMDPDQSVFTPKINQTLAQECADSRTRLEGIEYEAFLVKERSFAGFRLPPIYGVRRKD